MASEATKYIAVVSQQSPLEPSRPPRAWGHAPQPVVPEPPQELSSEALDMAVVRVKHGGAWCEWNNPIHGFHVFYKDTQGEVKTAGHGATEPEALADAAAKVIEADGYEILQPSASGLWYVLHGDEDSTDPGYSTRELALESAKRDYIAKSQPESASAEQPAGEKASAEEWTGSRPCAACGVA